MTPLDFTPNKLSTLHPTADHTHSARQGVWAWLSGEAAYRLKPPEDLYQNIISEILSEVQRIT